MDEFIADDLAVFIERGVEHIALGHFQETHALGAGAEHGADLGAQAFAEIVERGADGEPVFGESGLGAAIGQLLEDLAHGDVDRVAHEVGVESLEDGFALEDLGGHGGGMGHAGAADGFHQRFFDHAFFHIERELAAALLRRAPADAVGETGNVADLFGTNPLALFGDRSGAMVAALADDAHVLDFF